MKLPPKLFISRQALQKEIFRLEEQATRDPLTGLLNRHGFYERIDPLVGEVKYNLKHPNSKRKSVVIKALSLLVLDLDDFKVINDSYGHSAGDRILVKTARILTAETRSVDLVTRWGGEEFIIALLGAPNKEAIKIAENLRKKISKLKVRHRNTSLSITSSIGVATFDDKIKLDKLINQADKALYQAKQAGKNRVASA